MIEWLKEKFKTSVKVLFVLHVIVFALGGFYWGVTAGISFTVYSGGALGIILVFLGLLIGLLVGFITGILAYGFFATVINIADKTEDILDTLDDISDNLDKVVSKTQNQC